MFPVLFGQRVFRARAADPEHGGGGEGVVARLHRLQIVVVVVVGDVGRGILVVRSLSFLRGGGHRFSGRC